MSRRGRSILGRVALATLVTAGAVTAVSRSMPAGAVTGGVAVDQATFEADWPFAVAVANADFGPYCTGSLITPSVVVTAAHCVTPEAPDLVVTGSTDLANPAVTLIAVSQTVPHPQYDANALANDVALIFLEQPAPAPAQPATLPSGVVASPISGPFAGWGLLSTNGPAPSVLHTADGLSWDHSFSPSTWYADGPPGACPGDSGGPLVTTIGGVRTLVGVASFGGQNCGQFSAYTDLSRYLDFLAVAFGPIAHVTAVPDTGPAPLQVAFDLSASTDGNGDPDGIVEYRLEPGDGRPMVTSSAPTFSHTYTAPGTFDAMACAVDAQERQACTDVTVQATGGSPPDIVGAFSPDSGPVPLDVTFDLSASTDDGTIVGFAIDPGDGSALIEDPGPVLTHAYNATGNWFPTAYVTDDSGYTSVKRLGRVTVETGGGGGGGPISLSYTTSARTGPAPLTVDVDFTGSTGQGQLIYVLVGDQDDPTTSHDSTAPSLGHTYDAPGEYTAIVAVIDENEDFDVDFFTVTVLGGDTTPPVITVPGPITSGPTSAHGANVSFTAPTALDNTDGAVPVTCSHVSGALFPFGETEVFCSATDAAGNTGEASFTVTVTSFAFNGFGPQTPEAPASAKANGGSTVPMRWTLRGARGVMITDLAAVLPGSPRQLELNCKTGAVISDTPGASTAALRSAGDGFIFNWKTPKKAGCWAFVVGLSDGSTHTALVTLR